MRVLVLGGGGLKAFWLAGRVQWLAENGYETPHMIVGTSAGALVGSFLSNRLQAGQPFKVAAQELVEFMQRVKQPSDIARKRSIFELGLDLYKGRWHGLYDLTPLYKKLGGFARPQDIAVVCDLRTGQLRIPSMFPTSVLASASEPILTKGVDGLVDGGLREILPIAVAIGFGATHVTALCTQSLVKSKNLPKGELTLFQQILLTLEALTDEIISNDLDLTLAYNQLVVAGRPAKPHHRLIELTVHRATVDYSATYANFSVGDTTRMLQDGRWPE